VWWKLVPYAPRGPSGLPAPIQEQANRGFKPPVFLRGFFAAAQQSHALRCTGDKDEELLGQRFRIGKLDHAAIGIDRQDTDNFAKWAMAIALDKELRKAGESGCFGNEKAMEGKNLWPERQTDGPQHRAGADLRCFADIDAVGYGALDHP
jgi:hypothetical protein